MIKGSDGSARDLPLEVLIGPFRPVHSPELVMLRRPILSAALFAVFTLVGCMAEVQETPDSTKIEVETPKVEVGDAPVDLDPRTDEDIDVDTPAPGDR
jgi:hypothetical protein